MNNLGEEYIETIQERKSILLLKIFLNKNESKYKKYPNLINKFDIDTYIRISFLLGEPIWGINSPIYYINPKYIT